jgi:hypothetical protein
MRHNITQAARPASCHDSAAIVIAHHVVSWWEPSRQQVLRLTADPLPPVGQQTPPVIRDEGREAAIPGTSRRCSGRAQSTSSCAAPWNTPVDLDQRHMGGSVRVLVSPPVSLKVTLEWWRGRSEQPDPAAPRRPGPQPRFYRDLLGLAICREFGPPDDPGLLFFPGPGCSRTPGTRPTARVLGDDLDPGPRC